MARTTHRVFAKARVSMMSDPDFLALEADERSLFLGLWIHDQVNNAGVSPWRPGEMTHLIGASATVEDVRRCARVLQERKYVMVDPTTHEILVRSYIRNDDVVRQPNMCKPMVTAFYATRSLVLRQMIINELHRLLAEGMAADTVPSGFTRSEPLRMLLATHPVPSVPVERLNAWAADHPHRRACVTPVDETPAPLTERVWTPVDDYAGPAATVPPESGGTLSPTLPATHGERVPPPLPPALPGNPFPPTTTVKNKDGEREARARGAQSTPPAPAVNVGTDDHGDGALPLPGMLIAAPDVDPKKAAKQARAEYGREFDEWFFPVMWHEYGTGKNARPRYVKARESGVTRETFQARAIATWNAATSDDFVPTVDNWFRHGGWEQDTHRKARTRTPSAPFGKGETASPPRQSMNNKRREPFRNATDPAALTVKLGSRARGRRAQQGADTRGEHPPQTDQRQHA